MNFGDNLRNLRKSKKISQEVLAEKVGVSRQSVSKWETSEAYPEMNNILELCKIFHCHINDLVNDNIIDIDSLDEDVKMSIVKLKKQEQKKMKGLSNILSLIGKIGRIVTLVIIPFVALLITMIPIMFNNIEIKDNKIESKNKDITIVENDNEYTVMYKSNIVAKIDNADIAKVNNAIKNNSKTTVIIYLEIGFITLVVFLIIMTMLLKHLELLFKNINEGDTPFTLDNVNHIKKMTYFMIACIFLSGFGEGILNFSVESEFSFNLELFDIVQILFLFSMAYIFEYGYHIQLDSKGKMYGDENE